MYDTFLLYYEKGFGCFHSFHHSYHCRHIVSVFYATCRHPPECHRPGILCLEFGPQCPVDTSRRQKFIGYEHFLSRREYACPIRYTVCANPIHSPNTACERKPCSCPKRIYPRNVCFVCPRYVFSFVPSHQTRHGFDLCRHLFCFFVPQTRPSRTHARPKQPVDTAVCTVLIEILRNRNMEKSVVCLSFLPS